VDPRRAGALFPVIGRAQFYRALLATSRVVKDKVMAGGTPANLAGLVGRNPREVRAERLEVVVPVTATAVVVTPAVALVASRVIAAPEVVATVIA
jgi:hypothetical protein